MNWTEPFHWYGNLLAVWNWRHILLRQEHLLNATRYQIFRIIFKYSEFFFNTGINIIAIICECNTEYLKLFDFQISFFTTTTKKNGNFLHFFFHDSATVQCKWFLIIWNSITLLLIFCFHFASNFSWINIYISLSHINKSEDSHISWVFHCYLNCIALYKRHACNHCYCSPVPFVQQTRMRPSECRTNEKESFVPSIIHLIVIEKGHRKTQTGILLINKMP